MNRKGEERTKNKHDKAVQHINDDDCVDDDFVESIAPTKQKVIGKKRVGRPLKIDANKSSKCMKALYESYPKLTVRCSPSAIFEHIKELTSRQRPDAEELGFGHIVKLTIDQLPSRLAHWLVKNFNPVSCELALENGRRIKIEASDVHRVLGFPIGGKSIEVMDRGNPTLLYEQWKSLFHKIAKPECILQKHVVEIIKQEENLNGGTWFKRHFTILLASCLIETTLNGYILPNIIGCLADIDSVKKLNWSEYVIRSLVRSRTAWNPHAQKSQHFVGPALFFMVYYVDMVKVFNMDVSRQFPIFINWNYERLKERQDMKIRAGGFGKGRPLDPIVLEDMLNTSQDVNMDNNGNQENGCNINIDNINDGTTSENGEGMESEAINAEKYSKNIVSTSKIIAEKMVELLSMIENAPPDVAGTSDFMKSVEAAQGMIWSNKLSKSAQTQDQPKNNGTESQDDEFWKDDEVWKSTCDFHVAEAKFKQFLERTDDMPDFSIGLTPLFTEMDKAHEILSKEVEEHEIQEKVNEQQQQEIEDEDDIIDGYHDDGLDIDVDETHERVIQDEADTVIISKVVQEIDENVESENVEEEHVIHNEGADEQVAVSEETNEEALNDKKKADKSTSTRNMTRRAKNVLKKSENMCSPYVIRAVDIKPRLTMDEVKIAAFIWLKKETANMDDLIFKNDYVEVKKLS